MREKRADGTPWMVAYRALGDDPRTLDPQVSYDTLGHAVLAQIYECPLQYHPFKKDVYELIPCLLEEMPRRFRQKDGRESYLCRLKRGLYFHDDPCFTATQGRGREVFATDMEYVFKRIADPKVECPVLSTLQDYVVGLKDANEGARKMGAFDYSKPLPAIEIIDSHTFRLHLLKAYPQIQYWFAMPFTAPVPREAVEYYDGREHGGQVRSQFKFHPVGTGPFRLSDWRRNRLIRLVRHDRYMATRFPDDGWPHGEDARFKPHAGKIIPFLDEVQFSIIRESIPAWLLFRQGYLDTSGISKDVFNTVLNISHELTPRYRDRGVHLYKDSEPSTYYLIFNMEDPILGRNRKLRQAISCVYDEDLAIAIFRNGIDLNAQQLLPPGIFGHQSDFRNPYKQHDLALAKKLMAEAGYPEGTDPRTNKPFELTLDVTADDAESRQYAEFQKSQIEKLGIRVKLNENLWARQQEKVDLGHFQIVMYGWHADYPDPENFFFLFYSRNIPPKGSNGSRYTNPEFDRVFERMSTMDNTPERLKLIHQLDAILTEDCPFVLLSHPVAFHLSQPWSPRATFNALIAGGLKYARANVELRQKKQYEWNQVLIWPLLLMGGLVGAGIIFTLHWSRQHDV